jgi:glycine cleavage system H protein
VNAALDKTPELVNEGPYDKGWMVLIQTSGALPGDLMDAAAYEAYLATLDH